MVCDHCRVRSSWCYCEKDCSLSMVQEKLQKAPRSFPLLEEGAFPVIPRQLRETAGCALSTDERGSHSPSQESRVDAVSSESIVKRSILDKLGARRSGEVQIPSRRRRVTW